MVKCQKAPSAPVDGLLASIAYGRAVHAYLLIGPAGSGKRAAATGAARALLCRHRSPSGAACGVCDTCTRTGAGSHPDWHVLTRTKASIGVDEVRGLLERLSETAYEGGHRVAIIQEADKLTPQAQNALLKGLEEPAQGITFFLLAIDASLILPTVLSRCRVVRLAPTGDVVDALTAQGVQRERALELALLSGDSLTRALELAASPSCQRAREKAMGLLGLRAQADVPSAWQAIREDKDISGDILLWLECAFADMLRAQCGLPTRLQDTDVTNSFTFKQLHGMMNEIVLIRKKLGSNVPWNVAVEPLLYKIAEGETE